MNRLLVICAMWASACGPVLNAQTLPPPGRIATFEAKDDHYDLALSQGVAISISCYDGGACKDVVVSTGDAKIADVYGASIGANALRAGVVEAAPRMHYSTATTSGFVIVGKTVGKTEVKVKTSDGSKTINVDVLAPPGTAVPAVVAR